MIRACRLLLCTVALIAAAAYPTDASAQAAQASITGVVRDASGDVVPGVTVEVASPALIERTRAGVTDGRGFYRIIDLPGGTYTVTFTLTGFTTIKREGVELEGAFAAQVNGELSVGALTETVLVSAQAPIVNVQSAQREDVLRRDVITTLPIARDWMSLATLIPGMRVTGLGGGTDMGGLNLGEIVTTVQMEGAGATGFGSRGFGEGRLQVDGLSTGGSRYGSGSGSFLPDISNAQEVQIVSSGGLGAAEVGGPVINIIPRAGGNKLEGSLYYNFSNGSLQGNNVSEQLLAENPSLPSANRNVIKLQDVNVSAGGPIKKDRLWYFGTIRNNRTDQNVSGVYYNKNANLVPSTLGLDQLYVPDFDRTALNDARFREASIRLTWQVTQRNKVTFAHSQQYRENFYNGGGSLVGGSTITSPEAGGTTDARPQTLPQVTWTSPRTNRLLLEAGFSGFRALTGGQARPSYDPAITRITQTNTNIPGLPANATVTTGAQQWNNNLSLNPRWRASAAYVTGGHNLRVGYNGFYSEQTLEGHAAGTEGLLITINRLTGARSFTVTAVNGYPSPAAAVRNYVKATGLYVEDQWTRGRLTVQAALRFDAASSGYPEQVYGPGLLVPSAITFPAGVAVSGYRDLTPRVGVAYDLFGNGRTAVKFNFGHYMSAASNDPPYQNNNPTAALSNTTPARSWTDNNNNLIVDCDIKNGAVQGPGLAVPAVDNCAAVNLGTLGTPAATTTVTDQRLLGGWGVRPDDYQFGFSVQQQIGPRLSVEVSYRRRWQGNFTYTDNLNIPNFVTDASGKITSSVYAEYRIVSPLDGSTISGLYDINSNTLGTNNLVLPADSEHDVYTRFHDIDVNISARMKNGLVLRGGTQTGKRTSHICGSNPDNPGTLRGCHIEEPYLTQYSGSATYLVPKIRHRFLSWASDISLGTTLSAVPTALTDAANYTVPTGAGSEFFNQIGRAPLSGVSPVVNLRDPGRPNYTDMRIENNVRIGRVVRIGRTRANVGVDIFNFPNTSSAVARNNTYNPANLSTYLQRTQIIPGRFAKFSVQFDF